MPYWVSPVDKSRQSQPLFCRKRPYPYRSTRCYSVEARFPEDPQRARACTTPLYAPVAPDVCTASPPAQPGNSSNASGAKTKTRHGRLATIREPQLAIPTRRDKADARPRSKYSRNDGGGVDMPQSGHHNCQ